MSAVWEQSQHKGSELLLLLAIADFACDLGVAWPSITTLATKTRMSYRQTVRLLQAVAETGELWAVHRARQQSNLYCVTVGLTMADLQAAAARIKGLKGVATIGSDTLTPPPQVVAVVTNCQCQDGTPDNKSQDNATAAAVHSDTAMAPDPSLSVIEPAENEDQNLWPLALADLALQLDPSTFDHLLRGTAATATRDNGVLCLTVHTRGQYAAANLDHRLRPGIERCLAGLAEGPVAVRFEKGKD